MKAQSDNPITRSVQSSTPARVIRRQWTISSRHRLPLPMTSALPIALQAPPSAAPATRLPLAPQSTTHLYVASARMREIWRTGCVARTAETTLDHSCRRSLSRPCYLAKNRLTCPCQTQNAKTRRRRAARARRAAPAVARPTNRPTGPTDTLARRNSHRACPLLHCRM